ncbi:hypothetical protein [Vibrio mexicanus]|uniref:hypothetical protein n=1 Tax=Vibrio mexicanus TaxID=1004326 RepID=UPI00063C0072|nr:hypothetical protein [Vibrio mexicanus]
MGTGIGAIADGANGAQKGAVAGAALGAIDGLVEGAARSERCQRDLEDLETDIIVDDIEEELDRQDLEDAIIVDELSDY